MTHPANKAPEKKTFRERSKCPKKHVFTVVRRISSAGRVVSTYCLHCGRAYQIKAGSPE